MAKVSALFLEDDWVAPHLRLLRNVCEPESSAQPHVTIRYFEKLPIPTGHLLTEAHYIDLLEPATFGDSAGPTTVFIRCHSDELLALEHKPYFPTSEFHLTIYDGSSQDFARRLIDILRQYSWAYRVPLKPAQKLKEITLKKRKHVGNNSAPTEKAYPESSRELFREIFGRTLSYDFLSELTEARRLRLVDKICTHLASRTDTFEKVNFVPRAVEKNDPLISGAPRFETHLTPPELADSIAKYALSVAPKDVEIDFGDPAVGTGAFFSALLKAASGRKIGSAIGIDINPEQVAAAKWRWEAKGLAVMQADYLHLEALPARSLILANPPYLRHQEIPSAYKTELRQRASVTFGEKINAYAGQYLYFILLSHAWMRPSAVAAWLIPAEFMQTIYGQVLRRYLVSKVRLVRIHLYSHEQAQFENARVLPCVVVFSNEAPLETSSVELSHSGTLESPTYSQNLSISHLKAAPKWSIPFREIEVLNTGDARLGDLFVVRRGVATGSNKFFILERSQAQELGIPPRFLRPILPKARNFGNDVIEAESDGFPALREKHCLIDCDLPEEVIREKYPMFWSYLEQAIEGDLVKGTILRLRKPWYKQEKREAAPFLCSYMGRIKNGGPAFKFFWNKSNATAANSFLMLYPKPFLSEELQNNPELFSVLFELLRSASRKSMNESSRRLADGLIKIEPRELSDVIIGSVPVSLRNLIERDRPLL